MSWQTSNSIAWYIGATIAATWDHDVIVWDSGSAKWDDRSRCANDFANANSSSWYTQN